MNIYPTGSHTIDALIVWCAALACIAGGTAIIWRLLRGVRRLVKRIDEFFEDWQGAPGRPGHPGQLGVMARLEKIEHELQPNSGHSLRDAVDRMELIVNPPDDESLLHKVTRIEEQMNGRAAPNQ